MAQSALVACLAHHAARHLIQEQHAGRTFHAPIKTALRTPYTPRWPQAFSTLHNRLSRWSNFEGVFFESNPGQSRRGKKIGDALRLNAPSRLNDHHRCWHSPRAPSQPKSAAPKERTLPFSAIGTVVLGFGNTRHSKRLTRRSRRRREEVNAQWHLYCMPHNIEKLANSGWRQ